MRPSTLSSRVQLHRHRSAFRTPMISKETPKIGRLRQHRPNVGSSPAQPRDDTEDVAFTLNLLLGGGADLNVEKLDWIVFERALSVSTVVLWLCCHQTR